MADVKNINGYTIKDATARSNIGTISSLTTTDKTSLVAAVNEVNSKAATNIVPVAASGTEEKNLAFFKADVAANTPSNVQFDADKEITFNPSTNALTVAGDVRARNAVRRGEYYNIASGNNGKYVLLAQASYAYNGNHDIAISGSITNEGNFLNRFSLMARSSASAMNVYGFKLLYNEGGSYKATYDFDATSHTITIRLYAKIIYQYQRIKIAIDTFTKGDIYPFVSTYDSALTFPMAVSSTMTGTEIAASCVEVESAIKAAKISSDNWISDDFNKAVPKDGTSLCVFTVLHSASNTPATGTNYLVIAIAFSSDLIQQEAIQNGTNNRYIRNFSDGTWSAWKKLATDSDIATKQNQTLDTPLTIGGSSQTTVEGALGALASGAQVNAVSITWADLKAARDGGTLVAGKFYRITDYVTKTAASNTQSAGHQFDVIVRADSTNVLNENAYAALHSGDTYFASSKLNAWKLKYCLDNDTARFDWADTTNGKGVIYQMIDEFDNDLPYDFKNIQFKRWGVAGYLVNKSNWALSVGILNSLISSVPSLRWGLPVYESAEEAIDDNGNSWWQGVTSGYTLQNSAMGQWKVDDEYDLFVMSNDSSKWFYTFSGFTSDSAAITDSSLSGSVYKNKFGSYLVSNKLSLGNNVFIGNSFYSNTIGNSFNSNTIGNGFYSNTIGNGFNYNTIGNSFYSNTIGNDFRSNTIGNSFYYNTIGNDFIYNTIGNSFISNTIGNDFIYNTIGNGFNSNTIGNGFYSNTIGNDFRSNTIGNDFNSNTIGNDFYYNTIGNGFNSNTIGNYYKWNHVEDGCQNLEFSTNGTSSNFVQKYRVLAGTAPSSTQTVSVTAGNAIPYNVKQTGANTISVSAA